MKHIFSIGSVQSGRRSGQMLVESLVAISILTIGFLGIVGLLNQSISTNRLVADNFRATYLASEGVEIVKNLIDHNAIQRNADGSTPWNNGLCTGAYELSYMSTFPIASLGGGTAGTSTVPLRYDAAAGGAHFQYTSGDPTPFYRTVRVYCPSSDVIKVVSTVSYTSRGGAYSTNAEDYFYNWRF